VRKLPVIDPEIAKAHTLPGWFYGDAGIFLQTAERVFAKTWQALPAEVAALGSGRALPLTLLPDFVDEPLVATRSESGERRLLSNVCTHRGNLVVLEGGACSSLRCGYHGRRFGLDGRCASMPEFEGVEGFPATSDDLMGFPVASLGGVDFTNLGGAISFDEWLGPIPERVEFMPLSEMRHDPSTSRTYTFDASWALYCDNYLEGFHIPFVHPELNRALSFRDYQIETFATGVLQVGTAAEGELAFEIPDRHPDAGRAIAAYYYWLFPNTMLNFYPWGLSLNVVEPISPTRTRVRFESWVIDPAKRETGAGAALDLVERQDEDVVVQVQRGVSSRAYDRGRYSPTQERGVHHFHRLLVEALR